MVGQLEHMNALIGRETELQALTNLVQSGQIVYLHGLAGTVCLCTRTDQGSSGGRLRASQSRSSARKSTGRSIEGR